MLLQKARWQGQQTQASSGEMASHSLGSESRLQPQLRLPVEVAFPLALGHLQPKGVLLRTPVLSGGNDAPKHLLGLVFTHIGSWHLC